MPGDPASVIQNRWLLAETNSSPTTRLKPWTSKWGANDRVEPVKLWVGKQYELLSILRSSFYHVPMGEGELNLNLMRLIVMR